MQGYLHGKVKLSPSGACPGRLPPVLTFQPRIQTPSVSMSTQTPPVSMSTQTASVSMRTQTASVLLHEWRQGTVQNLSGSGSGFVRG